MLPEPATVIVVEPRVNQAEWVNCPWWWVRIAAKVDP